MMAAVPVPATILLAFLLAADRPAAAKAPVRPPPAPKTTGTVAGVLRHKGCQSRAAGATVGVIGRDVEVTSDDAGRFALPLPPGTYSLVLRGPNLVPDQRVDDVAVALGQTRDLGTVEVWPEERPQNCGVQPAPSEPEEPVVATAPDTPSLDLPGTAVAAAVAAPDQVLVRGSPGTAPGQFGLQGNPAREDEDALGPPSFAVGPQGSIYVLDVLNNRIERFDPKGRPSGTFALQRAPGAEPVVESDIAVADEGYIFVFTAGESPSLAQYDGAGRLLVSGVLPASFKGVDLLFAGKQRPVFLMQNGQSVRAELGWGGLKAEGPFPGLPAGEHYVQAERVSRWLAALRILTPEGRVKRSVQLHSRVPIVRVRPIGVDRRGEVLVAVDRAEGPDDQPPLAEVLLLAITPQGQLAGAASVPPGDRRFEWREFAIAPDGAVIQMQSDADEVRFVRWVLSPPPRESLAGEGLVKGRVFEGGKPAPSTSVTVGRARRPVPLAADGTFEVRLPAGTYVVAFRTAAAPDGAPLEVKVAVAAGATVDLGTVALPPRAAAPNGGPSREAGR
jgi:hypothetical protein